MSNFLAIDGGGTQTRCLLADDHRVLARATGSTVKLMRVSEAEATEHLRALLAQVAEAADVPLKKVTRTCFGLAGVSSLAVQAWARRSVAALVGGELLLCGDEEIALDAAFAGGSGVVVVAGTGSNAIGRSVSGEVFSAGGLGPVLGDEGSGYWIGLEAVRAVVGGRVGLDADSGSGCLLRAIERYWGINSVAELVALGNQRPGPDFATLAPVVARCADEGDLVAVDVLERAGEELAQMAARILRKMSDASQLDVDDETAMQELGEIGVACSGSVLTQIPLVRAAMVARLGALAPGATLLDITVEPLDGALWRARRGQSTCTTSAHAG